MRRTIVTVLAAASGLATVGFQFLSAANDKPDYGDSTLRYYASRSDRIVVADVVADDLNGQVTDSGRVFYDLRVIVRDVLKGTDRKDDKIRVEAVRWDAGESQEAIPALKKGTALILFLSKDNRTADEWFGVQPFNSWMVRRLRGIAPETIKADSSKPDARGG
jgi:hypothetical protein